MAEIILISTTFSNREEGKNMAKGLLEKRLIACAQLSGPVESQYWWKEQIESSEEFVLTCKTTQRSAKKVQRYIEENHSYETPEVISQPVASVSEPYSQWVFDEIDESSDTK